MGKLKLTDTLGAITAAGDVTGNALSGGLSSTAGNVIGSLGDIAGAIPGPIGAIAGAGLSVVGGLVNRAFGSQINEQAVQDVRNANLAQSGKTFNANSNSDLLSTNLSMLSGISQGEIGKDGWFSNKAKNLTAELNEQRNMANMAMLSNYSNAANNVFQNNLGNVLSNYAAYGGPLTMKYTGPMSPFGNTFKEGGKIHIKPENRGKFTALKKRTGKSATWFKEHGTPAQKKMAIFALNAKKWKHADGGGLYTDKSKFTNDMYNGYRIRLLRDGIPPEQADRIATYMTTQSAFESGYGSSNASKYYNYAGHLDEGEGGKPKRYNSLNEFMDYHYSNMKSKWPDFYKSNSLDDFYNNLHSGKYKYSLDSRDHYMNGLTGTQDRVNNYLTGRDIYEYPIDDSSLHSYLNNLPPNLRNTDSKLYNIEGAYQARLHPEWSKEDQSWHLESRNPNTGEILKTPIHPTYLSTIATENALGNIVTSKDGKTYSLDSPFNIFNNKKSLGGAIHTNGGIFSNGVTEVNEGGTHEENPLEGVQMGIDNQGIPNLVEEGEVIFNDYVFSNRMKVPKDARKPLGLGENKNMTFADAAKKLSKESEERPNDPISKNGLNASLGLLTSIQEGERMKKQRNNTRYANGGKLSRKYLPGGPLIDIYSTEGDNSVWSPTIPNTITPYDVPVPLAPPATNTNAEGPKEGEEEKGNNFDWTWLRYTPVLGAAIGLGQNIFSKPDYSTSNAILEAANNTGNYEPVSYKPIGDYLTYNPLDRNYYSNKLRAQANATRRAIINQSAGNRATALAGLLAADYSAQGRLGDLARQAEEYNLAQRQAVGTFNRATNMANSEMGLKAAMANQEAALKSRTSRLSGVAQAMAMRDDIDNRRSASYSANLTNLFNSLGDIGREEYIKNMINSDRSLLYGTGKGGNQYYKRNRGGYLTIDKRKKGGRHA